MRLLHVAASYLPATRYGGTIVSVHGLCRALATRGHEVHVFTTSVDGPVDSDVPHDQPVDRDGVNVWYFRSRHARRIYWSPPLGHALHAKVGEFDVVHTHAVYLWPMWRAARAAHQAGVPYVVSPRGMMEKGLIERQSPLLKAAWIGFIERRTFEEAAAIHVTSAREAEELRAFGFNLPPCVEVPNGVDFADTSGTVSPVVASAMAMGRYVLFLGRLHPKKGLDRLVAALQHAPEVSLLIAGNDESGYREVIMQQATAAGVSSRVRLIGPAWGADKHALLHGAAAVALTSYSENFGNVVLEAMAAGTPVVVTPEVGLSTMVRESDAGMVTAGAPEAIASALRRLWQDPQAAAMMGRRGREIARQRYTWDAVAGQMSALYERLRRAPAA
jgi:glycosyltransferase involved in cell wall biosynthesis